MADDDGAVMDNRPKEVPLIEQLRSVPIELRVTLEIQWAEDGTATGHRFIPVGYMMHRAADELDGLQQFKRSVDAALNSGDGSYRP
jgi:hypothetical protein